MIEIDRLTKRYYVERDGRQVVKHYLQVVGSTFWPPAPARGIARLP